MPTSDFRGKLQIRDGSERSACWVACLKKTLFSKLNYHAPDIHPQKYSKNVGTKIKFLAVREVRPNLGSFWAIIYKGFPKFIKGKKCLHGFGNFTI